MKSQLLTAVFALFLASASFAQNATDIIISEYCEYNHTISSQFYNHYIELYNGTGAAVDMSQYQLWRSLNATGWNNNGGVAVTPLALHGMLPTGETYVITRPDVSSNPISIASDSTQSWFFLNISGNDAIGLAKNDGTGTFVLIDLIGSETTDPGTGWTVAGMQDATYNHTLVRNPNVCSPTTNWTSSAADEWQVKPENDISDIGQHTQDCSWTPTSGDTISALFIGNSYTYYFDMPVIVANMAQSTGNFFIHDQSTPGGYTLEEHSTNATTLAKLAKGNWDFVSIQEQSTRPVRTLESVQSNTFPYALILDSLRKMNSPCGQTVFYRTWGRKNGYDQNCTAWPYPCTYEGMDSLLALRYGMMQEQNEALISPVGDVWRYIRDNHPTLNLYDPDESHPSAAGSYLSAITFYTVLFQKDPSLVTYDFTIDAADAEIIRNAAKAVVFDSLYIWNDYREEGEPCDSVMTTGFIEPSLQNRWKMYPNPTTNALYIEMPEEVLAADTHMNLYNMEGVLMKSSALISGKNEISIAGLSAGLYMVQVQNSAGYTSSKVVIW
jgi:hypothetical protein